MQKWSSWDEKPEEIKLCDGISVDISLYDIKENRNYTLIVKGVIVYLLTMGGLGSYLSAIGCQYSGLVLNLIVFVTAILFAVLYRSLLYENLGYLIFFVLFAGFIYIFRDYINSGFYAVINDTLEVAMDKLSVEGMQQYNERIANRYLATTISMSVIGIVVNIFINNYINRRMRYIVSAFIACVMLYFPLYLEREPSTIYTIMLLTGIAMSYFYRGGGHYKLHRSESAMKHEKKGIGYSLDYKIALQTFGVAGIVVFLVVSIITLSFSKTNYAARHASLDKIQNMETISNFFTYGIAGLVNFYSNNGGLSSGKLGGVSSVRLDHETDIKVRYTPYSYDTVYIRNYTGVDYIPYDNVWNQRPAIISDDGPLATETDALSGQYEDGSSGAAKGVMDITNVEAYPGIYLPYYAKSEKMSFSGQKNTVEYYPLLEEGSARVKGGLSEKEREIYLNVPVENREVIKAFCEEAGIGGTDEEVVNQLDRYFEANIPYTIRPGSTPRGEDFVNYFLTKGRKGYCSYFASASVLVFRYNGIPARYVEGYAISYNDIADSDLAEDAKYSDYYDGYSPIGETAVIDIEVTDASAHAWTEIYDEEKGWVVVDTTPPGLLDEDEDEGGSFWDFFQNAFGDGADNMADANNSPAGISINDSLMRKIIVIVLITILLALSAAGVWLMRGRIREQIAYGSAGLSDKAVIDYRRSLKAVGRYDREIKHSMNYNEQVSHLRSMGELDIADADSVRFVDILEKAGFSNKEISGEEYTFFRDILSKIKRPGRSSDR